MNWMKKVSMNKSIPGSPNFESKFPDLEYLVAKRISLTTQRKPLIAIIDTTRNSVKPIKCAINETNSALKLPLSLDDPATTESVLAFKNQLNSNLVKFKEIFKKAYLKIERLTNDLIKLNKELKEVNLAINAIITKGGSSALCEERFLMDRG